jgi:mRNA-degrading endonuclease RelE of RelBE toxin-antitoxin system
LPAETRTRIETSLLELAAAAAVPGRIGGKRVRTIRGAADSFQRLRAGDYRVMYDVILEDRVVHVLAIVHRGDLERWLRSR